MSQDPNFLGPPKYDFGPNSERAPVEVRLQPRVTVNRVSDQLSSPVYDFSKPLESTKPADQSSQPQHSYVANVVTGRKVAEINVNGQTRDVVTAPVHGNQGQFFGVVRGGRLNSD